jgi:hypothetical protein
MPTPRNRLRRAPTNASILLLRPLQELFRKNAEDKLKDAYTHDPSDRFRLGFIDTIDQLDLSFIEAINQLDFSFINAIH